MLHLIAFLKNNQDFYFNYSLNRIGTKSLQQRTVSMFSDRYQNPLNELNMSILHREKTSCHVVLIKNLPQMEFEINLN